jgi:hypothetical protein
MTELERKIQLLVRGAHLERKERGDTRPVHEFRPDSDNLFCLECGDVWGALVHILSTEFGSLIQVTIDNAIEAGYDEGYAEGYNEGMMA